MDKTMDDGDFSNGQASGLSSNHALRQPAKIDKGDPFPLGHGPDVPGPTKHRDFA